MNVVKTLVICFMLSFFFASQAYAECRPVGASPWYKTELMVDSSSLPSTVIYELSPTYFDPSIINHTSVPFYLVVKQDQAGPFINSELPANYMPLFKLVNRQLYEWEMYDKGNYRWGKTGAERINLWLLENTYLGGQDKRVYKDDRPENVVIPDPQSFVIQAFYNGQDIEIPVTISYSLNEFYDSKQDANSAKGCAVFYFMGSANEHLPKVLGLLALILGGVFIVVLKLAKRK